MILSKLAELCDVMSYEPLKSDCKARQVITDVMIREIEVRGKLTRMNRCKPPTCAYFTT